LTKIIIRQSDNVKMLQGGRRIEFWICLPDGRFRMGIKVKARAELNDPEVSHVFIAEEELNL
jgi:hypothetical protein